MSAPDSFPVAVAGLWHLGTVTAACLASRGISTLAYDADQAVVDQLAAGHPPLFEPGLEDLVRDGIRHGLLEFTAKREHLSRAEMVWVTWDTPVDDEDKADVEFVTQQVTTLFPHVAHDCLILLSSQLPVGTTRRLETAYSARRPTGRASFACSPENLRLGKAIEAFTKPERLVLGVRSARDADRVRALLAPFEMTIDVMRVESAELTKHALNGFLATSVAFANEVARLAERVGADAREVERALKSDVRIGKRAYVRPGDAYAGGTLARDVTYLVEGGQAVGCEMPLLTGVRSSNDIHRNWSYETVKRLRGTLAGARVAVLGLTYKSGTDTLRRSPAVELCSHLAESGADLVAYDPAVKSLPEGVLAGVRLAGTAKDALRDTEVCVIATDWPEFRQLTVDEFLNGRSQVIVIDPGGFLSDVLSAEPRIQYAVVGKGL